MLKTVILVLLMAFSTSVFTQTVFSNNPEEFLKQIDKYLSSVNRSKAKPFIEEFGPVWLTKFPKDYQSKVVSTSNLIVAKRLPAFPDLHGYLLSTYSFVNTNQPKESFASWHATIDKLLNSKKIKKFKVFIEMCSLFFTDGTIYSGTKHLWGVRGGTYRFEFEKNNPKIYFDDATFYCYVYNKTKSKKVSKYSDSTVVRMTSGRYQPLIFKWEGKGGKIDWAKVEMDPTKNYAMITDYMLSLKSTKIVCDSVEVWTDYYDKPLQGSFVDIAKNYNREVDKIYPQFISFSKKIEKKNILPNVDYVGGFAIEGNSFTGVGYGTELATLIFYKDGKTFVKASSKRFKINAKGANAIDTRIVLYLSESDSIFHPGAIFKYDTEKMELSRSKDGLAQAPFSNSFHQLDMYVEKIIWTNNDNNLDFTWNYGASKKVARFESKNYFNDKLYTKLQGMSQMHPLVAVYKYYYKYDKQTYPISEAASYMGITNQQAIPILLDLANLGFITYNKSNQTITILPKTKKYIDAKSGKSDYDDIVFVSDFTPLKKQNEVRQDGSPDKQAIAYNKRVVELNKRKLTKSSFGTLNLKSLDLKLNEISYVELSVLQRVIVFPKDGELVMKKNRDFLFAGAVSAGKLESYPRDATFDYENFKIHLLEVDETLLRVKPIYGGYNKLVPMVSHIRKLKGEILIDDPNNRSGNNKKITDYPKLVTKKPSYVFYNHKAIYNGTYDSTTFYFKLDPFEFDSLDNYDEHSVAFSGELRSSGIFPVFKEKLRIQEDYSFGFKTKAPQGGYNFYGDDAKYNNDIRLSNQGLRGSGEINFLTSHTVSKDFIFFADSTMGISEFTNKGQTKSDGLEVPDVVGSGVMVTYLPKQDILKTASTKKSPIYLFDKQVIMSGETQLTKNGMTGWGNMFFEKAKLSSRKFEYKRWIIDADTANFDLADIDGEKSTDQITFATNNVNAHVDLEGRKGEFKSNDGTSKVEFPVNQYFCYMDQFTWLMDSDEMDMSSSGKDLNIDSELDLAGPNFFSVHPDQDSLRFRAPKATFSLKNKVITCSKIEFIDVADARISPSDQQIIVRKKAKMDPFEDATIVANFVTKYHTITNAHVEISARRKYLANGNYVYIDAKKNEYKIKFSEIRPDTTDQTIAMGEISMDENFKLSPQFDFYGDVFLQASEPFLTFDGATRINHECDQFAKNWMKFKTEIDPENIQIPVNNEMKDLDGNPIAVGIVLRNTSDYDSLGIYPAFLSALDNPDDKILFTSSGVLTYNETASEFRIASKDKLVNRAEKGNYISLHTKSCSMNGDGRIDLQIDLPDVTFKPVGTVNYNMQTGITTMNVSGALDFFYDEKAVKMMGEHILNTEELLGIDFNTNTLEQAIKEDVNEAMAENIKSDYLVKGEVKKVPKEMQKPIYFTNLRLKWDNRSKAFLSSNITGIVNLYDMPIFKDFTVRLAIQYSVKDEKHKGRGDKLSFMVDLPGAKMYYYHFERIAKDTKLQVFTSNKALRDYLLELKEDKRKQKKLYYEFSNKSIYIAQFKSLFGE
ncbi:MAG TPA: hypothetical protein EYG85_04860 [Crocinitomix sp.]|nr:hypothetical protein [Crocinitomix sp.]